jgi:hypothetical protein
VILNQLAVSPDRLTGLEVRRMLQGQRRFREDFVAFIARCTVFCLASVLVLVLAALGQAPHSAGDAHHPGPPRDASQVSFDRLMAEVMERMNRDMLITHSGDADRDFAAMMIPHHQGAIDMAKVELQFGHDQALRRLAQGIIVEQQQEIDLMRRQLERLAPRRQPGAVK